MPVLASLVDPLLRFPHRPKNKTSLAQPLFFPEYSELRVQSSAFRLLFGMGKLKLEL
jgi:hypothetical protein